MAITMTPQVQFRTVDGVRIRYADSGKRAGADGRADQSLAREPLRVLAHVGLACRARSPLRFDLPGFGASERRENLLSPRAMGTFLTQLIAEVELGTPHIVAPDVGTSAALFAAAAHPERIASVIVGTGGASVPIQLGEPLASWVLDPDLDKYRRMDPRAIVNAAVDTIAGGVPTTSARTTWLATTAIASSSRCAMCAGIPRNSRRLPNCCRRSRRR